MALCIYLFRYDIKKKEIKVEENVDENKVER